MKSTKLLLCAAFVIAGSTFLVAQANVDEAQGIKQYDSLHGGDLDSVSLTSGGLALHVPLVSFPQRGNLDLSFGLYYSSKQWTVVANCTNNGNGGQNCTYKWQPLPRGGALPMRIFPNQNLPMTGAYITNDLDFWLQGQGSASLPQYSADVLSPDGSVHQFGTSFAFTGLQYPMRSLDATGFLNPDANTVVLPNGTRVTYSGTGSILGRKPTAITDANGNQITVSASGWTDTVGRSLPGTNGAPGVSTSDLSTCPSGTTSAQVWDVPSVAPANGGVTGTRRFKFCYSMFTISTNFGTGATEYGPASNSLLSAVVLPDLTMWTLSYDNYGDLTRLGFPIGGSIAYTYDRGPVNCGGSISSSSMWVKSRAVDANDGTGAHTWAYSYSGQFTSPAGGTVYTGQAKVTSPDGNDTVHTITSPVQGAYCSLYDTQVQYFQGAAGGTPLKTVTTQYTGIQNPADASVAANMIATQVTLTQGGQTSRVVNQYDSGNSFTEPVDQGLPVTYPVVLGSLLQRDEYDFSNTLGQSTVNHYLWQDNASYKSNNFASLPVSTTIKDGAGNQLAQTTYAYDQFCIGIFGYWYANSCYAASRRALSRQSHHSQSLAQYHQYSYSQHCNIF